MGCGEGCVKLLVFSANLIFAFAGLGLITVGVLYKLNFTQYTEAIPSQYENIGLAPIFTIVVGSVIFLIAFFGCCGAVRESPCLLTCYAVILLVIFLAQIALGIFAFLEIKDKSHLQTEIKNSLETLFNNYNGSGGKNTTEIVNLMQKELQCCGINGYSYWGDNIPGSCCKDDDCSGYFSTYCPDAFYNLLVSSTQVIAITVLAISATEVVGAIFSLCLSNSIKNRERRFRY